MSDSEDAAMNVAKARAHLQQFMKREPELSVDYLLNLLRLTWERLPTVLDEGVWESPSVDAEDPDEAHEAALAEVDELNARMVAVLELRAKSTLVLGPGSLLLDDEDDGREYTGPEIDAMDKMLRGTLKEGEGNG